jgi:hypothetical protein
MIRMLLAATTVALWSNFASTATHADITIRDPRGLIDLEGVISKSDVTKFSELVRVFVSKQDKNWTLRLNSPGGDVLAAMEIGLMVRKEWMRTWSSSSRFAFANPPRMCASACVLILAAGARRSATEASIGVHRPRFDEHLFAGLDHTKPVKNTKRCHS